MIRESLQLSQRAFGEKLGVSRDVISNIESGRVHPKELLVRHILDLYSVNENWLRTGSGSMFDAVPKINKKLEEAVEAFQNLCPEYQDYALMMIRGLSDLQEK